MEKRKRGRPKKVIPEEVQKVIDVVKESKEKEEQEFHQIIVEAKNKYRNPDEVWDVPLGTEIKFFDSRLSYEITKYRPINKTRGLNFNPEWFTEPARTYKKTERYCQFMPGSKLYRDYWQKQYEYCRDGITVNGFTITGDHYYFLNFYRLEDLTSAKKAGGGRNEDFPQFFVAQYEYFHYIEMCKVLRKDTIGLKARGVGFSEIAADTVVNTYNCRRGSMCVVAAQQEIYTAKTLSKCWTQLNFCNEHTDGGFFKLRQKKDTATNKKASIIKKINGEEVETGWGSEINGITADKPGKIRGDRTDILLYEESGSWPNWKKAYIQGEALVNIQGQKFGIRMAWGTGGDSGPALAGLADAYINPEVYGALPYRHNFTTNGEEVITSYFIPAYSLVNVPGYIDNRGYCDPEKSKAYHEELRKSKIKDKNAFIIYCAEYCFTADEALLLEGTNKFNKVIITDQLTKIKLFHQGPTIQNGELQFLYKQGNERTASNITGVKWIPGDQGLVHIIEKPLWESETVSDEGEKLSYKEMRNLYVAGIDGIDIGQDQTSDYTKDPSKFCITIKKRAFGMQEPMYVAYYKFRPNDEREAYETAMKLMIYYNCRCNIEATRLTMLNWAKGKGWKDYFMHRPLATYPEDKRKPSSTIGTPATVGIIAHQTDLIAQTIEDYGQNIWFPEMLDELARYTDENKGKFDIVAAMGMAELADEELSGVVPSQIEEEDENKWQDIGFYYDEKGIKHYGVIPKENNKQKTMFNWNAITNSNNGKHSSDPRYMNTYE